MIVAGAALVWAVSVAPAFGATGFVADDVVRVERFNSFEASSSVLFDVTAVDGSAAGSELAAGELGAGSAAVELPLATDASQVVVTVGDISWLLVVPSRGETVAVEVVNESLPVEMSTSLDIAGTVPVVVESFPGRGVAEFLFYLGSFFLGVVIVRVGASYV